MSKNDTSQTQQKTGDERGRSGKSDGGAPSGSSAAGSFEPIIPMVLSMDAWGRLAQDNLQRLQALYDELAGFESAAYERTKKAGDDLARMMDETASYMGRLAAEWRNLSLEATRRGAELLGVRA